MKGKFARKTYMMRRCIQWAHRHFVDTTSGCIVKSIGYVDCPLLSTHCNDFSMLYGILQRELADYYDSVPRVRLSAHLRGCNVLGCIGKFEGESRRCEPLRLLKLLKCRSSHISKPFRLGDMSRMPVETSGRFVQ